MLQVNLMQQMKRKKKVHTTDHFDCFVTASNQFVSCIKLYFCSTQCKKSRLKSRSIDRPGYTVITNNTSKVLKTTKQVRQFDQNVQYEKKNI
jgi:hypothetical protein